jgi:hypothetical protein
MTVTSAVAGLTPQQWDDKFFTNYVRSNQFSRYMGMSENSLIQVKEDLTKKNGDKVTYALVNDLVGAGVSGSTALEGAEEALGSRSATVTVALARNGVVVHEWDEQKSAIDLRNACKAQLKSWLLKKDRTDIINALGSINGVVMSRSLFATHRFSLDADLYLGEWSFPQDGSAKRVLAKKGLGGQLWLHTPLPGDIVGWLETFAESFTRALPPEQRPAYLEEVRAALEPRLRGADGIWVADYVRLRFSATKL